MLFILPVLVLIASFPAQSKEIEIPNPYPKPKAILEQIFLKEGETLKGNALRYAEYADFSLGCYRFYSFMSKLLKKQVKETQSLISKIEELNKLTSEGIKKRKKLYNSSLESIKKLKSEDKLYKNIRESLIPHFRLGIRKLAEQYPSSVIQAVAEKKYAEVFIHYVKYKQTDKYAMCPVKIEKPLLTDRSIPFASKKNN